MWLRVLTILCLTAGAAVAGQWRPVPVGAARLRPVLPIDVSEDEVTLRHAPVIVWDGRIAACALAGPSGDGIAKVAPAKRRGAVAPIAEVVAVLRAVLGCGGTDGVAAARKIAAVATAVESLGVPRAVSWLSGAESVGKAIPVAEGAPEMGMREAAEERLVSGEVAVTAAAGIVAGTGTPFEVPVAEVRVAVRNNERAVGEARPATVFRGAPGAGQLGHAAGIGNAEAVMAQKTRRALTVDPLLGMQDVDLWVDGPVGVLGQRARAAHDRGDLEAFRLLAGEYWGLLKGSGVRRRLFAEREGQTKFNGHVRPIGHRETKSVEAR